MGELCGMSEHLETRAMFAGHDPALNHGAVKPAIQPSSTFVFPDAESGARYFELAHGAEGLPGESGGFIYSRLNHPTLQTAETRLAAWDQSEDAAFFSSGMAAVSTALMAWSGLARPIWHGTPLYGGTEHMVVHLLPDLGIPVHRIDPANATAAGLDTLLKETGHLPGVIYLETPANPTMQMTRIADIAQWARKHETPEHRIVVMVDNTYLGPILQRPLALGADLLIYSATKYLGGHSDLIAGAVSGRKDAMQQVRKFRTYLGGVADAWTAWLLARSMETLHIRVQRQQETASEVLAFLRRDARVFSLRSAFPEDLDDATAAIAREQTAGGGSMLAFEVAGGKAGAQRFLNALKHFQLAVSLGSTESLAEHPATMTHSQVDDVQKAAAGITDGLVRLSIGLEHPDDLIADLDQALGA
jgi:methionine-gamma-lyase